MCCHYANAVMMVVCCVHCVMPHGLIVDHRPVLLINTCGLYVVGHIHHSQTVDLTRPFCIELPDMSLNLYVSNSAETVYDEFG